MVPLSWPRSICPGDVGNELVVHAHVLLARARLSLSFLGDLVWQLQTRIQ